jgi:hypothetical protein
MKLSYNPKSEKQIEEERLIPKGPYPFEVIECEKRTGDYGDFIRLKLKLTSNLGNSFSWGDIISLSDSYAWKLRHACDEMGLLELYENGELELESFLNRRGTLIIDHKVSKKTELMEAYVKDYGVKREVKTSVPIAINSEADWSGTALCGSPIPKSSMQDDDIPF